MSVAQEKIRSLKHLLEFTKDYDSMYREALDGFIGIKQVPDDRDPTGHSLEMITVLDTQAVFKNKHQLA